MLRLRQADLQQRIRTEQEPLGRAILGCGASGEVMAIGEEVHDFQVGKRSFTVQK